MEIETHEASDVTIQQAKEGMYKVITKGNDPYFITQKLSSPLRREQYILSFEYFSTTGFDDVKLYFGPPIRDKNSKDIGSLNLSEGWTTFSIDLEKQLGEWGKTGDYLRIDLGDVSGKTMKIRNIQFRKPTEREREIAANKERRKKFEAQLENDLKEYFQKSYTDTIENVRVTNDKIIVQGHVALGSKPLFVREVRLQEHVTELNDLTQNYKKIPQSGLFEVQFNRYVKQDGHSYDRLFSKWVIVEQKSTDIILRSHAHYPDKIKTKWHHQQDTLRGRKGLGGFSAFRDAPVSDLDSLGISSVTVNIRLTKWMRSEPSENTMPFRFNGKTYYVDRDKVNEMDQTLRATSSRNIIVSAIILINQAADIPDKIIGNIFEHPDSDPAGIYSMANVTSAKGIEYYAAIMDFLAKRYNRPDEKYGRIHHWIVHNEVDAGWVWTNAGNKTPLVFMDLYHKSMRLIYNIVHKYNSHAKVFISLTHYWNWTSNEKFYHSRDLLEILLDFSHAEGDFEWGIAHHPYPQDLFDPKAWLDPKVNFTFDTPLITYKNIEVLNAWVNQPKTFYHGEPRTIFLSEQGLNSRDYGKKHLQAQAAGMAYAWKKIEPLKNIAAFQYHNWQDSRGEGGLRIGLRRFPDAEENPGGRKPIWNVYRYLNTSKEDSATDFAKDIIGVNSWDQLRHKGAIDQDKAKENLRDVKSDSWVATDALGRSLPGFKDTGKKKNNRTVGIFYFLTHTKNGQGGPYDVSKILAENPDNPQWGKGSDYYWGEPETGYYLSTDEWMIRRHARMLTDAGVDVIIFDVTNDNTHREAYMKIAKVFREMRSEGEKTPKFAFLGSHKSILTLWDEFYSKGLYPDLWFHWKGNPLLMFGQHKIPGRKKMDNVHFPAAITNFFTIRQSWAWTSLPWYDNGKKEWPWIDHFPQSVGWDSVSMEAEYVPVGVAEHPLSNIGRSFHNFHQPETDKYDLTAYTDEGLYFQEQWSRALEIEPGFVFITGWNEWSAGKQVMGKNIQKELMEWDFYPGAHLGKAGKKLEPGDDYFIDQYNQEYSRDIEPMKGGHGDNYYYQMMANIRRYKGVRKPRSASSPKTINLDGYFSQWNSIKPVFRDHKYDTYHRNSPGNYEAGPYINNTGRNDIVNIKVSRDKQYVYFYVSTREDITDYTGPNWMLLYIDADQNKSTGWDGYDYLVNKNVINDHKTTIKRYNEQNGWSDEKKIAYSVKDNQLMLAVPRNYIHMNQKVALNFHWVDNPQKLDTISDFFMAGDNAPDRRANYRYQIGDNKE